MADWTTISALATAGGTLVLAAATFVSVRSTHESTRITERALLAAIRPLLLTPRLDDPPQKVPFMEPGYWQGAFRDSEVGDCCRARDAIAARESLYIDVLYGDYEGGQRTLSRFALVPMGDDAWITQVSRHWNVDRPIRVSRPRVRFARH